MPEGGEGKGLSAAGARKITRRVTKVRLIEPPAKYTIDANGGAVHEGLTFKAVAEMCPKIKASTLKRRLEKGIRNLTELRRAPETKQAARMRRMKK